MSLLTLLVIAVATAAAVSYVIVRRLSDWAARHGVIDCPNERSSHTAATPRGGGLGIVAVSLGGVAVAWWLRPEPPAAEVLGPFVGGIVIGVVSWVDDLHSLPVLVRLVAHVASAVAAVSTTGPWRMIAVPPFGMMELGWLSWPLTVLWIVGLTNAYNFMDGIDGLAAGQAIVAGVAWAALGAMGSQPLLTIAAALLAGSSAGFLGHNWPPARVFMGDVGSAFLGYALATLPLLAARTDPVAVLTGALLVWPFVFDAAFTFGRRVLHGQSVFIAHRSHLYQRLVITGLQHGEVSALYGGLAVLGAILAVGLASGSTVAQAWPIVVGLAAVGLWSLTVWRER